MGSRERLLKAIKGGEPDRVPVGIHNIGMYLPWLRSKLGREIDDRQALKLFGFDPTFYRGFTRPNERHEWKVQEEALEDKGRDKIVKVSVRTPRGKLTSIEKRTPITTWRLEPLLKRPEDLDCLVYQPVAKADVEAYKAEFGRLGKEGIIRSGVSSVSGAIGLRGSEQLCRDFYERPDWIRDLFKLLTQKALEFIEGLPSECIDLVEIAGHIGSFISPRTYEKIVLPYDTHLVRALHNKGLPTTYHNCGKVMHLLELIASTGTDCLETLTPSSHGGDVDLAEAKLTVGKNLCLIGGFDQALLERGSKKEIEEEVKRCVKETAVGGGYLLYNTDHFFEAPMENLHAMVEAARKFGHYGWAF